MAEQKAFGAPEFVNLALSPISSTFGRLVLLADLRDSGADPLAVHLYGKEDIDAALEWKHRVVFFTWLCMGRAAQHEDVAAYFADQARNPNAAIEQVIHPWVEERLYERLSPITASEADRQVFSSDLRAILELVRDGEGNHGG